MLYRYRIHPNQGRMNAFAGAFEDHRYTPQAQCAQIPKLEKISALCKNFPQLNTSVL